MTKFADRYLKVEDWGITEEGFHPERSRVSESLFSQANELLGVRASFEEGFSGDSLPGNYIAGIFGESIGATSYKGVSNRSCFMVNAVNVSDFRICFEGEDLDLARAAVSGFSRHLDFRTGLLSRSFIWTTNSGQKLAVKFERFLSMTKRELVYQRIQIKPFSSGQLAIRTGLDFSGRHESFGQNFWENPQAKSWDQGSQRTLSYVDSTVCGGSIVASTRGTSQLAAAAFNLTCDAPKLQCQPESKEKYIGQHLVVNASEGQSLCFVKTSAVVRGRDVAFDHGTDQYGICRRAAEATLVSTRQDFDSALMANRHYWDAIWAASDIVIEGDAENQQGIRFCIFQLQQTYSGAISGTNIGAKGLSGEFYDGKFFWDTEVFCLPYYLFQTPEAARGLLMYRYETLPQALERAGELDCQGACFPISTIDGSESCTLWQHASLQLQPSTAVSYAVWHYVRASGDREFVAVAGLELVIQVARFLASRVQWSERKQAWGYYAVMGPDEFQMMVNHNAYTNYMGARSLAYAADLLESEMARRPAEVAVLLGRIGIALDETTRWRSIAENMYLPRDPDTKVIEQHEGFFDLPHVDIHAIPAAEFPLYHSWSYDRIYRNDMIKQPDVLMFMLLYNDSFSPAEKLANYDYYEPRCIHESSLSPSVHSILAAELGKPDQALDFFRFATRIDLDNYNRNTREGLHLTAIAAAWMNIVYGFGGFRSDGRLPSLAPSIPPGWTFLSFRIHWQNRQIEVRMDQSGANISLLLGESLEIILYGKVCLLEKELVAQV